MNINILMMSEFSFLMKWVIETRNLVKVNYPNENRNKNEKKGQEEKGGFKLEKKSRLHVHRTKSCLKYPFEMVKSFSLEWGFDFHKEKSPS